MKGHKCPAPAPAATPNPGIVVAMGGGRRKVQEGVRVEQAGITTSSGRRVLPKRFHDDDSADKHVMKRLKISKVEPQAAEEQEEQQFEVEVEQEVAIRCEFCSAEFLTHVEHFEHLGSHVPGSVLGPAGLAREQGWCPHCPGPVTLATVPSHIAAHHPHLL